MKQCEIGRKLTPTNFRAYKGETNFGSSNYKGNAKDHNGN